MDEPMPGKTRSTFTDSKRNKTVVAGGKKAASKGKSKGKNQPPWMEKGGKKAGKGTKKAC